MAAQNWVSAMQGVSAKVTQGVQSVTQAPGQAAAAQQGAYLAGVNASAAKWAARVAAVPLASWQQAMVSKGIPRMAQGAQASQGKYTQAMQTWLPRVQQIVSSLPARGPKGTNQARMTQFSDAMHQAAAQG
jgi:hypothetical protein